MTHLRRLQSTILLLLIIFSAVSHAIPHTTTLSLVSAAAASAVELDLAGSLGRHGIVLLNEGAPTFYINLLHADAHRLTMRYSVFDHEGALVVAEQGIPAVAEPADGLAVVLSSLQPGWYRFVLQVEDETTGRPTGDTTRDFVVLRGRDKEPASSSRFGIQNAFGLENERLDGHEAAIMRHIGAKWILGAATPTWADTQFQPGGHFIWRTKAEERERAQEAGLIPLGSIGSLPAWVSDNVDREHYLTDYFQFVQTYTEVISGIGVVGTRPLASVSDMLATDYIQLKTTPAALWSGQRADVRHVLELYEVVPDQLDNLFANGIHLRGDALLVHLPEMTSPPEQFDWSQLKELQLRWNQEGGSAGLWTVLPNTSIYDTAGAVVESSGAVPTVLHLFGTNTRSETDDDRSPGSVVGVLDSPKQAQWLVRAHLLQLSAGIERIFAGPLSTGPSGSRLFSGGAGAFPDIPRRPRPSLAAYATMTEQLTGATYIGQLDMPQDIWAFVFSYQGEPIMVVWTTRERAVLELNNVNAEQVEVVDALGASGHQTIENNRLILELDAYPRYVRGLDAGVIAQGLTDEFIGRVALLADVNNTERDRGQVFVTTEALQLMATELWLYALTGDDASPAIDAWFRAVTEMFALADELWRAASTGQSNAQAALYELYAMLPAIAEAGAAIGASLGTVDAEGYISGTDALLREAIAAAEQEVRPDGSSPHHARRLLEMSLAWWDQNRTAPFPAASAWSIIVREAVALAAVASHQETPRTNSLFIASSATPHNRSYPGFRDSEATIQAESIWERISQWVIPEIPGPTVLRVDKLRSDQTQDTNVEGVGWDELDLTLEVVNTTGESVTGYLELSAPERWLWQIGDQLLPSNPARGDVPVVLPGTSNRGQVMAIDLGLLVPFDAEPGDYSAMIGLYGTYGFADRITFTIQVDKGTRQRSEVPSLEPDVPSIGEVPEHL